jgi:hypothetical protein
MFSVAPGSIHFLGTYKYRATQRTLGNLMQLTPETYGLTRVGSPTEAEVLRMLAANVQSAMWKQRIQRRLSQLPH